MSTFIKGLEIVLQSRVGPKARKDVVRKENADGPYRNRKIQIALDLESGAGSGANSEVRRIIVETLRREVKPGELLFYVVAEFEQRGARGKIISGYFKTIVPRSEIPLSIRSL